MDVASFHASRRFADVKSGRIAFVLMGLGYTEIGPTQDVSFTAQAQMVAEVLDALGIDKIDLVANDSGGAVAQIFAAHHPERLRSLVLTNCDVHDGWPPPQVLPATDAFYARRREGPYRSVRNRPRTL